MSKVLKINKTLKGIPKEIRVGVNTYKIILKPNLKHTDGSEPHGYCCRYEKTIHLNSNNMNVNMAEVLLHELLHAIWYEFGFLDFKRLNEEQAVNSLSTSITVLMLDNPKLSAYFNTQWKRK